MKTLHRFRWPLTLVPLTVALSAGHSSRAQRPEAEFRVWVESPMIRVQPETRPNQKDTIEIAAARNEVEPFQVIVSALSRKLEGVTASISNLEDGKGNKIDHSQITLYREQYVYVRNPSP